MHPRRRRARSEENENEPLSNISKPVRLLPGLSSFPLTMIAAKESGELPMSPIEQSADLDGQLEALLERCASADAAALQNLYELAAPLLFGCLTRILRRRALAEEALQDVFVSIWQRAGQFRASRGRPMAWMMSIARYRAIDLLRHERSAPVLVPDLPERGEIPDEGKDDSPHWMPASGLLERCLALLTDRQRHCLELAFVGGNSHEDISRLTGNPLGTVKSWIRRGLQSLRNCLEGLT
jgi:RNA polymerase sigma-70 factor (ECF subfamily)